MDLFCYLCLSLSLSYCLVYFCRPVITCWVRADHLALLYVNFSCVFVTVPHDVLGHLWYLIVSIPDLCLLYFNNILKRYIQPKAIE